MKKTESKASLLKRIDPTELLRKTLADRCAKNPQYSVRAFARATGISHTVLSLVLSGKRPLSKKAALKLADHLELGPKQRLALMAAKKKIEADDYQTLSLDSFEVISEWYHYAILSLLELPEAVFEAKWISQRLGINPLNAKLAMERLQRLSLVEQGDDGKWRQSGKPLKIDNAISTVATKKFHKQLLQLAADSIDRDPISVRDVSSMTFTLDPSQMEYARQRIRDFRRELVAELEIKGSPSSVYNFTLQLCPVTPVTKEKE
ncbi:TIGR02147 family protein [Bdellovibrio sp. HCB337]|uniref:TIGR02147 family protein n=1 Tax=Bdellovibrio sp. HCB337 TaxID=3394358 RepID=UPI0039A5F992